MLGDKPVLMWSVETAASHPAISQIVVVHPAGDEAEVGTLLRDIPAVQTAAGGRTRTESVKAGLKMLAECNVGAIMVHDAARPGLDPGVIDRLLSALETHACVVPVLPVADALWDTDSEGAIGAPVPREKLVRVQTPQAARANVLRQAYAALDAGAAPADDAAVVRATGETIASVAGSSRLEKITYHEDFDRMEALLRKPHHSGVALVPHVGSGFDAHKFTDGAPLWLCGVAVDHPRGLAGHSDADVGWHALCDAIYGALCEGDIGRAFPPSDPQWKGAASRIFLEHAAARIAARGGRLTHCDVTLICEAPRIGPHREAMIAATASILGVPVGRVSIKATTTERMGFTGRGEGIAALASATILLPDSDDVS